MKRSSVLWCAAIVATGCALTPFVAPKARSAALSQATPEPKALSPFPTKELAELDRAVQAYFAVIPRDGRFGYSRVPVTVIGPTHPLYSPTSAKDQAIVSRLRATNQDVVFFLVGRKGLADMTANTSRLKGPLLITSPFLSESVEAQLNPADAGKKVALLMKDAPRGEQLVPVADSILVQPGANGGARTQAGGWQIVACPVPASSPGCVSCHNSMAQTAASSALLSNAKPDLVSLGDPLGVALYCVRTSPQVQRAQSSR